MPDALPRRLSMETVLHPDRESWNSFIAASPSGHILQSWEWGEIKERTGWEPVRLALTEGGTIRAAAQVLLRRLPYGLGRLAYVPKGPVLDYGDPALLRAMMEALAALARRWRIISLKIEPEVLGPGPVEGRLRELGLVPAAPVQMRSTIWVDLAAPEEEILGRQKQKTRYNTRLAARKGVTVRPGTVDDLDAWYGMYRATAQRDGFSIHGRDYYRLVLQTLQPRGMANLLLAHHEGELLAGIIVFRFGAGAQYMYGASSDEKRNVMAPYLAQWEGMRWAKAQGATVYDLWGIPDRLEENEDLWGVYRHKRGYGGEIVRYIGAYDLVRSPLQHLALERVARPLFKRVARSLPYARQPGRLAGAARAALERVARRPVRQAP
ncbi:MAG: peptidoglycan bridge formation glycyltransferase FemA/FemB family protein [Chloroflexi bacterium]|nr:peptidoglycan bridge formation glycyltransferase FemA/FemB family protein [Chloroflexota bacterium]